MDSTGSILSNFVTRVRFIADEPSDDAIYTDATIIQHFFQPCYADVWGRINLASQGRVMLRYEMTSVVNQEFYDLPPNIGRVVRVSRIDDCGIPFDDLVPRNEFHPSGPGWAVQGNTLSIRPYPTAAGTFYVWYIPNGSVQCHYSTTGGLYATDTTNKTFTLGTPTLGVLDKRPNAYGGCILRVLGSSVHQERVIESYDPATGRVVLRRPLDPVPATSNVTYEIAPIADESILQAMALRAGMLMLAYKKAAATQRQVLTQEYQSAMKTVLDNAQNIQARQRMHYLSATVDNKDDNVMRTPWGGYG